MTVTGTDGTFTGGPTFGWTVTPASSATAPTITDPGAQSNTAGDTVALQINASSAAGALVYSATGLPGNLAIDPATGIIGGNFTGYDTGSFSVTVTVTDPLGGTASDTFAWVVAPAPVSLTVNALTAEAGKPTGPVAVATFTTTDASAGAGDFSATISWGDGGTSQGAITVSNGAFVVTATFGHVYSTAGPSVLGVTVTSPDGSTTSGSKPVTVAAANLSGGSGRTITLQGANVLEDALGDVSSQIVGYFQDSNLGDVAANLWANINWADGTTTAAVISGANGLFQVVAGHSYAAVGTEVSQIVVGLAVSQLAIAMGDFFCYAPATSNNIVVSSANINQIQAHIEKVNEPLWKTIKSRVEKPLSAGGTSYLQTSKVGDVVYYNFASVVKFAADANATGDVMQQLDVKQYRDGKLVEDATSIEGFTMKGGKSVTVDPHIYIGDFDVKTEYKTLKVVVTFTAGLGLYNGKAVKSPFEMVSKPDLNLLKFNDKTATKSYTVEFSVDQDGSWTYKDTGAGINKSGKKSN